MTSVSAHMSDPGKFAYSPSSGRLITGQLIERCSHHCDTREVVVTLHLYWSTVSISHGRPQNIFQGGAIKNFLR